MNIFSDIFSDYTFGVVALGSAALGTVSGVLGSFAVLRKQSLLGDGVSHSALPGVVAAFLLTGIKSSGTLLFGALVAGLAAAFLINFFVKRTKVKFDAALATVMSAFFGFGTVLLTCAQKIPDSTQAGLSAFIYGQASSMLKGDVVLIICCSAVLITGVLIFWKEFKVFSFDKDFSVQLGYSERFISLLLTFMTVAAVILGIQTVGVVLMSAMLIAPAAAARQWSGSLSGTVVLAAVFGAFSGVIGSYASAVSDDLPTGPAIVVAASAIAVASILFAPKRGIVKRFIQRKECRIRLTMQKNSGGEGRD